MSVLIAVTFAVAALAITCGMDYADRRDDAIRAGTHRPTGYPVPEVAGDG